MHIRKAILTLLLVAYSTVATAGPSGKEIFPCALTTRCQGRSMPRGARRNAWLTRRAARGKPDKRATSP